MDNWQKLDAAIASCDQLVAREIASLRRKLAAAASEIAELREINVSQRKLIWKYHQAEKVTDEEIIQHLPLSGDDKRLYPGCDVWTICGRLRQWNVTRAGRVNVELSDGVGWSAYPASEVYVSRAAAEKAREA